MVTYVQCTPNNFTSRLKIDLSFEMGLCTTHNYSSILWVPLYLVEIFAKFHLKILYRQEWLRGTEWKGIV